MYCSCSSCFSLFIFCTQYFLLHTGSALPCSSIFLMITCWVLPPIRGVSGAKGDLAWGRDGERTRGRVFHINLFDPLPPRPFPLLPRRDYLHLRHHGQVDHGVGHLVVVAEPRRGDVDESAVEVVVEQERRGGQVRAQEVGEGLLGLPGPALDGGPYGRLGRGHDVGDEGRGGALGVVEVVADGARGLPGGGAVLGRDDLDRHGGGLPLLLPACARRPSALGAAPAACLALGP
mmetsp:Transcript_20205/g.47485  ORF Transcript_20205/g.47485 Transcript_20205/m.47485 type:complete len:233 (+) Transcript_20205:144-842(+)